jgi:ABC-type uncharacterized transport system YnjBCD ATPase subunit
VLLEVTNLSVRYDKAILINNLSMRVDTGELVSLVGPNGAGKSTLLRAVTGLVAWEREITRRSTGGDVILEGTVTFDGTSSATVQAGLSSFYDVVVNKTGVLPADDNLTLSTNNVVITYTLTITATEKGGILNHSKTVKLSVDPGTWNFILDSSPDTQKVIAGDSATYKIIMRRHTCFTLPCTLSVESGLPSGATYHFSPNIIPPNDTIANW